MRRVFTLPVSTRPAARLRSVATPPRPRTYTVEEAARLLGISRSHAYVCVRTGELPSLRLRRRIVIPEHALEAMFEAAEKIGNTHRLPWTMRATIPAPLTPPHSRHHAR